MVRELIPPSKQTVFSAVPEDYEGKQIEVIAFAKNEGFNTQQAMPPKNPFIVLHTDLKDY